MLNEEVLSAVARLFDQGKGPSHDELTRLFERAKLRRAETPGDQPGKMKRVRTVLGHALEHSPDAGADLVRGIIANARACGSFREGSEQYAGVQTIAALRAALKSVGFELHLDGALTPVLLENLEGTQLTEALWGYVRRARTGALDSELVVGTAKNLEEAVAKHVLKERTGVYPAHGNFPTLLGQAFAQLGLNASTLHLNANPERAVEEAVFLLACAVNRLRNAKGDGHGRPDPTRTTQLDARISAQAAGLVAELLLTKL